MSHIGDSYYPEGIPNEPSCDSMVCSYDGVDGKEFQIVYTHEQMEQHVERHGGWFMPYIPLGVIQ
jgi:hypothetical protein